MVWILSRSLLRYLAQAAGTDRLSETTLRQAVTQALSGGDETMMTIAEDGNGRFDPRQESYR